MASEFSDNSDQPVTSEPAVEAANPANTEATGLQTDAHVISLDAVLKGLDMAVSEALAASTSEQSVGMTEPFSSAASLASDSATDNATSGSDDEISIEQYMKELLERTRGTATPKSPRDAGLTCPLPATGPAVTGTRAANTSGDNATDTLQTEEAAMPPEPKRPPERPEVLDDLRDLANLTAHQAINSCSCKRLAAKSRDTLLTAMVLQVVSFALVATTPPAASLTYLAAVAAFITSSFWTLRFAGMTRGLKRIATKMQAENDAAEPVPCVSPDAS